MTALPLTRAVLESLAVGQHVGQQRAENALAEVEAAGWLPLTDEQRNGEPLIAASVHRPWAPPEVVKWRDGAASGYGEADEDEEGWVDTGPFADRFYGNPNYFTHWMPLPAPPESGADDRAASRDEKPVHDEHKEAITTTPIGGDAHTGQNRDE